MVDAVQAGRGVVDYPGIFPIANNTVLANVSGSTALPVAVPFASLPASSLAVGTTAITGGTTGRLLYDNAAVLGETASWTTNGVALTGAATTSVAIGGATIGTNALAVTGTVSFSSTGTFGNTLTIGGRAAIGSNAAGDITTYNLGQIGFTSTTNPGLAPDTLWTRRSAANMQLGAIDAAAPVAQTLSVQSVIAGTTDTAGANVSISGSQSTGTGVPGFVLIKTAGSAASTGSTQNALATVATFGPSTLPGSQATSVLALAQTWNTTGTPSGLKVAITNTASNAASLALSVLGGAAGATSLFKVRIDGVTTNLDDVISTNGSFKTSAFFAGITNGNRFAIDIGAGQVNLTKSDNTGIGFDVTTAGTVKIRNTAQSADGAITMSNATLSGVLQIGNAYVAGAVVGTGSVTLKDSTGTTYRVPVLV